MGKGKIPILPDSVLKARQDMSSEELMSAEGFTVELVSPLEEPKVDVINRTISYTDFDDELSRIQRVLGQIQVATGIKDSVQLKEVKQEVGEKNLPIFELVEKYRARAILSQLGYDGELVTASPLHKVTGARLAKIDTPESFAKALAYSIPLTGTKSLNQFISGVRSVNPKWATELRNLHRQVVNYTGGLDSKDMSSLGNITRPGSSLTNGMRTSITLTNILASQLDYLTDAMSELKEAEARKEGTSSEKKGTQPTKTKGLERIKSKPDTSNIPGELPLPSMEDFDPTYKNGESGNWAPPVIDTRVHLTKTVKGYLHRRKIARPYGRRVAYPGRALSDPFRQVFAEKVRAPGGVIVIDVSGSMSLTDSDVERILDAAPGAIIIAYSDDCCDRGAPNITYLANRGKQVEKVPRSIFRGGNGVDGPALILGLRHRRPKEPLLWVCDGQVSGKGDAFLQELAEQVAKIVLKYKVFQVPDVETAIVQLTSRRFANIPSGRVGRIVRGL